MGLLYEGECHAASGPPVPAPAERLAVTCNFGYARGACPTFPKVAEADAVRFTKYNGRTIYVLEKDYSPVGHGDCMSIPSGTVLSAQASAFACGSRL